jgi:hypothetical protein
MRIERAITSLSWIPSEALDGVMKVAFEMGFTHYDEPPPDRIDDLTTLQAEDRFRFANELRAWIEVADDGRVTGAGHAGRVLMGATTVLSGRRSSHTFAAYGMPVLQVEPEVTAQGVRFVQTAGGRTGLPAPRRVNRPPFVQWKAPLVWSTLALTIGTDGGTAIEVVGSSPFPRHWIYGPDGVLALKTGMTDFDGWYRGAFGRHSPWGDEDSPALITAAETALERRLSAEIMRSGARPEIRKVRAGETICAAGDASAEVFLLLDGVVRVDVGEPLVEMGPGAVFGERALLESGTRTSTVVAVTPCRLAVADADQLDRAALTEVAAGHRHEHHREHHEVRAGGPAVQPSATNPPRRSAH